MQLHRALFVIILTVVSMLVSLAAPFKNFYGEAVYSGQFGFSTFMKYSTGNREGNNDVYAFVSNESSGDNAFSLPGAYGTNGGINLGGGMRYWFNEKKMFVNAEVFHRLSGTNAGKIDTRIGAIGFWASGVAPRFNETYGELVYTGSSEVVSFNVVHRTGRTLALVDAAEKIGVYGVGQVSVSSAGENSGGNTNGRIELGVGLRYQMKGNLTASCELRAGSYLGTPPSSSSSTGFVNPVISVVGMF